MTADDGGGEGGREAEEVWQKVTAFLGIAFLQKFPNFSSVS